MVTVAEYLSKRLLELGADTLFSIPGNYTAEFLLQADAAGLQCIGTTNELEAGYAADAYSRLRGIGVCSATYGVGTHSLYNAISGAYVEFCPVVLVNGSPPPVKFQNLRERGILFAHAIDPIRTDAAIFEEVTVASAIIDDPFSAPERIDSVLTECVRQSRPVYLEVLQGIWSEPCAGPEVPLSIDRESSDLMDAATRHVVELVSDKIRRAKRPVIWGGELLQRRGLTGFFQQLVKRTGYPYTTTLMGKALIPEDEFPSQFVGVYDSKFAPDDVRRAVESSDCLLALGTIMSDFYADIVIQSGDRMILASDDATRVGRALYPNVGIMSLVPALVENLGPRAGDIKLAGMQQILEQRESPAGLEGGDAPISFDNFFERLASVMDESTTLLVDTSLALFPAAEVPVRRKNGFIAQTAWLSIGYTCGATLGISAADPDTRVVTVVGDGGFQMIPQAFSTLAKSKANEIVFVLDIGTYGIEQYLVDMQILPQSERFFENSLPEASFFDVLPRWDYAQLGEAFGGRGLAIETLDQLDEFLANPGEGAVLVGVRIDQHDLPQEIQRTIPADPAVQESAVASPQGAGSPLRIRGFN